MSKKHLLGFVAGCWLALSLASCGKGVADVSKHIPEDATMVAVFNVGQGMKKADFETLKQMPEYKNGLAEAPAELKPYLETPAETGFDMEGKWMAFVQTAPKDVNSILFAMLIPIKDAAKFDAFIKKVNEKSPDKKPVDKKDYQFVQFPDGGFVAWNKKLFVGGAITDRNPSEQTISAENEARIAAIFNPAGKSIADNASFQQQNKANHDVMVWLSSNPLVKALLDGQDGATTKMALGMFGLTEKALNDNTLAGFVTFETGKIESGAEMTFNDELKKEFGGIFNDKMSKDFSKFIPNDVAMYYTLSLNADDLYKALSKRMLTNTIDNILTEGAAGFNSAAMFAAISGEAVVGVAFPTTAAADAPDAMTPHVTAVMGVRDRASADKVLAFIGKTSGQMERQGDMFTINMVGSEMPIKGVLTNDILLITNAPNVAENALKGGMGAQALKGDWVQKIQDGWTGMYIDYAAMAKSPMFAEDRLTNSSTWISEFVTAVGVGKGGKATQTVTTKTTDKNSLRRMIEITAEVVRTMSKDQDFIEEMTAEDETVEQ